MSEPCIYCSRPLDPAKGQGDHIIPALLGEFRDDVRFRGICRDCNTQIGRSEQQFVQCGPEGLLREVVQPAIPRRRKRGRSRVGGALGMPSPKSTIDAGDHTQIVEPKPGQPRDANPVDQLVVRGTDGNDYHFPLFRGMRPEQLRHRLAVAGIADFDTAWLHCDEANHSTYKGLASAAWPTKRLSELPTTEAGIHKTEGRTTFRFGDHYFRVIAKIAFHYYLVQNQRGLRGDEPEFKSIREFILKGGKFDEFFDASGPRFAVPFGERASGSATTPSQWCHILAAHEASHVAVGYVHLFAGPGCVRNPHHVRLGNLGGEIVLPSGVRGHVWLYDQRQSPFGYAGRVVPASVTRIR